MADKWMDIASRMMTHIIASSVTCTLQLVVETFGHSAFKTLPTNQNSIKVPKVSKLHI